MPELLNLFYTMQEERASKVASKLRLKCRACINCLVGQLKKNRAKGTKNFQMGKIDTKRTHHRIKFLYMTLHDKELAKM
jgi:hypothetical protein